MIGTSQPESLRRATIFGTARAASGTFTVTRTSSEPASASSRHCVVVASTSTVSVEVIDWTTTGAPPPTWTFPTFTPTVRCRIETILDVLDDVEIKHGHHHEDQEDEPRLEEPLLQLEGKVAPREGLEER